MFSFGVCIGWQAFIDQRPFTFDFWIALSLFIRTRLCKRASNAGGQVAFKPLILAGWRSRPHHSLVWSASFGSSPRNALKLAHSRDFSPNSRPSAAARRDSVDVFGR